MKTETIATLVVCAVALALIGIAVFLFTKGDGAGTLIASLLAVRTAVMILHIKQKGLAISP